MAKNYIYFIIVSICVFYSCQDLHESTISQKVYVSPNMFVDNSESREIVVIGESSNSDEIDKTNEPKPVTVRDRLQQSYLSQVGVREKTGNNDGTDVEKYLRATGLGKGYPWCSAFVKWNFDQVGVKTTITAWSPSAENKKDIIYESRKFKREPLPGDVGTLFFQSRGRIAHTFFFDRRLNDKIYRSVEGNTNAAGSREGDGVYIKYRSFNSTYSISSWIK